MFLEYYLTFKHTSWLKNACSSLAHYAHLLSLQKYGNLEKKSISKRSRLLFKTVHNEVRVLLFLEYYLIYKHTSCLNKSTKTPTI